MSTAQSRCDSQHIASLNNLHKEETLMAKLKSKKGNVHSNKTNSFRSGEPFCSFWHKTENGFESTFYTRDKRSGNTFIVKENN